MASNLWRCYKFGFHYLRSIEEQHLNFHILDFQNKIFRFSLLSTGIHELSALKWGFPMFQPKRSVDPWPWGRCTFVSQHHSKKTVGRPADWSLLDESSLLPVESMDNQGQHKNLHNFEVSFLVLLPMHYLKNCYDASWIRNKWNIPTLNQTN